MKIVLSKSLSYKLKTYTGRIDIKKVVESRRYTGIGGLIYHLAGPEHNSVIVDLSDHSDPEYDVEQCEKWIKILNTYFSTSYKAYKIDVGPFKGLYPVEIEQDKIHFNVDIFDFRPSWKDWFIVDNITIPIEKENK